MKIGSVPPITVLIFLSLSSSQAQKFDENERFACDSGTARPETRAAREGEEIRIYGHGIKKFYSKVEIVAASCQDTKEVQNSVSVEDLRHCRNIRLVRFFSDTGQLTISDRGCTFGLPSELRVGDQAKVQETASLVPDSPIGGSSNAQKQPVPLDDEHELLSEEVQQARAARAKWLKKENGFIFPDDITYVKYSKVIVFRNGQWLNKSTGLSPWDRSYSFSGVYKAMLGLFF